MLVDAQKIDFFTNRRPLPDDDLAKKIVARARILPPKEKLLIEMALINKLSHRQMAVALGRPAGTITRQLNRLLRKLNDPMMIALIDADCPLPDEVRWPVVHRLLGLVTVADLTAEFGLTPEALRQHVNYARGWYKGLTTRPPAPRWQSVRPAHA